MNDSIAKALAEVLVPILREAIAAELATLATAIRPTAMLTRPSVGSGFDVRLPIAEQPAYLRISEVALLFRRSVRTLSDWEARGLIKVIRPAGGAPLIERAEVERLLREGSRS